LIQKKLEIRVLTKEDVKSVLKMKEAIQVVEKVLAEHAQKKTHSLSRSYLFPHNGRIGFMPAYIPSMNTAGVKIVSAFRENPKHKLPVVLGTIILNDSENGLPIAMMDGTYITAVRTGAMGAIAAKYLSRKDSEVAGVIGAGVQGRAQLLGLNEVREIKRAFVYSRTRSKRERYADEMSKRLGIDIISTESAEKATKNADILMTCTTSSTPVIIDKWVHPGLHITSVGVSTAGKQELSTEILKRSKLVVDEVNQTSQIGGISVPFSKGHLEKKDIHAEIGEIILGIKEGRATEEEVTVFVTSGLSIQDISTAKFAFEKAMEQDIGKVLQFPFIHSSK
jgi:alanine dehydrogenase